MSDFNERKHKYNKKCNYINLILCGATISIFGLNPIALCLSYIGSSIVLYEIDKNIKKKMINQAISDESQEDLINDIRDYNHYSCYSRSDEIDLKYFIDRFNEEAKKLEILKAEQQKKEEDEKKKVLEQKIRGLKEVNQVIDSFNEFYTSMETKYTCKKLKKINGEFLRLKKNLEKKPQNSFFVSGSLATYTQELINLITENQKITVKNRETYAEKYEETLNEFASYLRDMNQKIEEYSTTDVELGIDTLLSELKEQNHKINGQ